MSIQFASPFIQSGPGITAENDTSAAITALSVDATQNTLTLTLRYGTPTVVAGKTTAFAVDPQGPGVNITFSMTSNTWQSSNGLGGNLTPAAITTVNNLIATALAGVRDTGESFAVTNNVFGAGATNVPW